MSSLAADLRHAFRVFQKSPGFTLTAVAAIALGVGANTAVFTVVNAVLLHPLPYPDSGRIINITRGDGGTDSPPMVGFWMRQSLDIEDLTAYDNTSAGMNLGGGDRPELVRTLRVSRNYFRLFGAVPVAGRTFTPEEDQPSGPRVLVMSYGLWQRRFGGQTSLLGKAVDLAGTPYTVIGILSPGFQPTPEADLWLHFKSIPKAGMRPILSWPLAGCGPELRSRKQTRKCT